MELQHVAPCCVICGVLDNLLRCAKCKSAFYCSIQHQHLDWTNHKHNCRIIAKEKKNNIRVQQLQQAVAANGLGASVAPTSTFPLATAATYNNQQSQQEQQLPLVNGMNVNGFADCYIDATPNVEVSGTNNLNPANPTMSVIYGGANENLSLMLNDQQNENMIIESPMQQVQQFYMDTASPGETQMQDTQRQVLSIMDTTQQPQQQLPQQLPTQQQQTYSQFRNQNSQQERSVSFRIGQADENVMANFNERRYEELCRNIINDMNLYGLSVVDDFLGVEKGMEVLTQVHAMHCAGVFQDGQLLNNQQEQDLQRTIRSDKITWVKGVEPGCTSVGYLINQIDAVICRANTMKNNGKLGNYNIKERTKAMVACYPGSGSHYLTHVDNPNKDGRVITAIYYLNVDWDSKRCGGVLRIFPEASNTVADIEPKFDRLIFFWSDKRNPHEVQPSHRTRYAITVWYFDANEREAALNRCKYGNAVKSTGDLTKGGSTPGFSNSNENSNPNSNTNFNANASHLNEICT